MFRGTETDSYHAVNRSDKLQRVNNKYVFKLSEIMDILKTIKNGHLILDFENNVHLDLDYDKIMKEDKELITKYGIS